MGEQGDTPERLLEGRPQVGSKEIAAVGKGSSLGHGAAPKTQERPEATHFMAPNPLHLPGVS